MRLTITTLCALALTVPCVAQAPAARGGDEAAIRKVVQQYDDARNRGDWKVLSEIFTEDADQLTSAAETRKGRAQIEKGAAQNTATVYKGGKYVTTIETVRMLAPGVALADGTFEIGNIKGGSRRGRQTLVLLKSGDRWRITALRSMVPTPAGATPTR